MIDSNGSDANSESCKDENESESYNQNQKDDIHNDKEHMMMYTYYYFEFHMDILEHLICSSNLICLTDTTVTTIVNTTYHKGCYCYCC